MAHSPGSGAFDLMRFSEATRRWLYERIAASEFGGALGPGPDEAGLQVVHFGGRWFALWQDLEEPATSPERLRFRLVRIGARLGEPGELDRWRSANCCRRGSLSPVAGRPVSRS